MKDIYDFIIIGGGVVGCAIARELSKYKARTLLLERECDVAMGVSGRNSGVDHAGFYMIPKTLKAKLNVEGHRMLPSLCKELDVPYRRVGKLVVARSEDEIPYLEKLKTQGERNGVGGLRIIDRDEIRIFEPNINAISALYSPTSAILDPFQLTIGFAESALMNGVEIKLNTEVVEIETNENVFNVITNSNSFKTRYLINSAGLYADTISKMAGVDKYRIYPCKGEYHVLDKRVGNLLNMLIYPVPPKDSGGLGIHLTPTIDGNIMLGPSAEYIGSAGDISNTRDVMEKLFNEARDLLPLITKKDFIRSFAGIRPKLTPPFGNEIADFVIKEEYDGFINLVGIESPGLTAAPAIAVYVVNIIKSRENLKERGNFNPIRKSPVKFSELSDEEKSILIRDNPDYGEVICRCETVTRKEIIDALNNPLGARSINSIKMRCRASMGRCQGSFCLPKIVEIMENEFNLGVNEINLFGEGSEMFVGRTKDLRR